MTSVESPSIQIADGTDPSIVANIVPSGSGEGGKLRTSSKPFLYDVAEGLVVGHSGKRITGFCPDVDNTEISVWTGPASMYVFPAAAQQMEVVSSNANDTAAGTGVRKVMIHYLDTSFITHEEEITLNGVTPVATTVINIYRVNCFHASAVGSGGVAAGNIDVRNLADTPVYSRILAGRTVCQSSIFTMPDSTVKAAYITSWHVSMGAAAAGHYGIFRLRTTTSPMGDLTPGLFYITDVVVQQDSSVFIPLEFPYKVLPGTDIMVTVVSDSSTSNAIASSAYTFYSEPV